ncbi:MaoC family dehydratase [Bacillus sp. Marseille-P3661]|uniref:MaoC family dehydratase n=1 Tax=Bacillus sp. Marseille-P3661 TaxID=1936234 RepID=UPI000C82A913|nr:MaoC family dehydratase [Bacillus sp. Marseille-P3661]
MQSQHSELLEKSRKVLNRPFEDISIGEQAIFKRIVTEKDILDFATLTGDVNPIHIDDDYAAKTMFKGRIAHGMLTAGFISTLLGTVFPGRNVIYLSQSCKFTAPVRIGDTIKIVGEVIEKHEGKSILTLQTNAYNQNDKMVIEGTAVIMKKEQL